MKINSYATIAALPLFPLEYFNWLDNSFSGLTSGVIIPKKSCFLSSIHPQLYSWGFLEVANKLFSKPFVVIDSFSNLLSTPLPDEKAISLNLKTQEINTTKKKRKPTKNSLEKIRLFKKRKYIYYGD